MTWMHKYEVEFYSSVDKEVLTRYGIVVAETWTEAATKLSEYYGEDDINYMRIEVIADTENGVMEIEE